MSPPKTEALNPAIYPILGQATPYLPCSVGWPTLEGHHHGSPLQGKLSRESYPVEAVELLRSLQGSLPGECYPAGILSTSLGTG